MGGHMDCEYGLQCCNDIMHCSGSLKLHDSAFVVDHGFPSSNNNVNIAVKV